MLEVILSQHLVKSERMKMIFAIFIHGFDGCSQRNACQQWNFKDGIQNGKNVTIGDEPCIISQTHHQLRNTFNFQLAFRLVLRRVSGLFN